MDAINRASARKAELDEALTIIGHQEEPEFWLPNNGTFSKSRSNPDVFRPYDEQDVAKMAGYTGWTPSNPLVETKFRAAATHEALQQFGVGVGHPLYEEMMERFDVESLEKKTKADLLQEYVPHLPEAVAKKCTFRDAVSLSIMVSPRPTPKARPCTQAEAVQRHVGEQYFNEVGDLKMYEAETCQRRALFEKYDAEVKEEERLRVEHLKRKLQSEGERTAKRIMSGSTRAPENTGDESTLVPVSVLEQLINKCRWDGRGHCDIIEIFMTAWGPPGPPGLEREPSAGDSQSGHVDHSVGSEDGKVGRESAADEAGASHGDVGHPNDSDVDMSVGADAGGNP